MQLVTLEITIWGDDPDAVLQLIRAIERRSNVASVDRIDGVTRGD